MTTTEKKRKKKSTEYKTPEYKFDLVRDTGGNPKNEYCRHKSTILFQGDVLNPETFDKEFIDLIVTSPPYNIDIQYNSHKDDLTYDEYMEFSEKWMKNCFLWSKPQTRFLPNTNFKLIE